MLSSSDPLVQSVFPKTCRLLAGRCEMATIEDFPKTIRDTPSLYSPHPYLTDLAAIELARHQVGNEGIPVPGSMQVRSINPALELLPVQWQGLPEFIAGQTEAPVLGDEWVLVYKNPGTEEILIQAATAHDLLALKIVSERLTSQEAAEEGCITVGVIDDILTVATLKGLLLVPPSALIREEGFSPKSLVDSHFLSSPTFTLQWHITQSCDLHCRHCYDRSDRVAMELEQGLQVLDQLYAFTRSHHVFAQVTFTGGNPLLYPHFNTLYQEAVDRGFMTAILGNPMPRKRIEEFVSIRMPEFYQVSLEGLREQNDCIRGTGHFNRTLEFLDLLRDLGVYSMVMLTLTRANKDDVLALAELLRDRVDLFTFNRLAMVGEGAALASVEAEEFPEFLQNYLQAAEKNPCMGVKDNLFNLLCYQQGRKVGGGCAGYGCGAAFNFLSLLPDGEVHACRKLPSLIGNLFHQSLEEIYHSAQAKQYRQGPVSCQGCEIRPVCGGCPAVAYGYGLDIFREPDPYCWKVHGNC
jgi:selenobiotic family peptide radical SAM maturase